MNEQGPSIKKCSHGVLITDESEIARYCTLCTPYVVVGDVPVISDFQEIKYTKDADKLLEEK